MKLRHVVPICLLTLPLTCFSTTLYLTVLSHQADPGQSVVISFTSMKPLVNGKSVDWKISCSYQVQAKTESALAVVKPELMSTAFSDITSEISNWSGKIAYGNLIWTNYGIQKEIFVYHQTSKFSPWHLSLTSLAASNPVTIIINNCIATS